MRLQTREAPSHRRKARLRLNTHLRQRLGAIDGLLLLSRNARRLFRRNTLTEAKLITACYQAKRNADNASRE